MVLGIELFRTEEGRQILKKSQKKRFLSIEIIDEIMNIDKKLREIRYQDMTIRTEIKKNQKEMSQKKIQQKTDILIDTTDLLNYKIKLDLQLEALLLIESNLENELNDKISQVGNIIDDTVPVSNDEGNNVIIKKYDDTSIPKENLLPHNILLEKIGGYDQKRGAKVVGHRGYFLTNIGVQLNMALQQYAINFLLNKGYNLLQPPYLMNDSIMQKTAELADYKDTLYRISGSNDESEIKEKEDKYLIATSEQPICAYHAGETISRKELPLKYGGISTCFRKEAGAHGKDVNGIFRIHQFEKIEQFVICEPENSFKMQNEMITISEEFYQSLGLSYRIIMIVSGALNLAAAKKYDLEAWFPSFNDYKELVSCSNCTDYQSRNLNIKIEKGVYPHMLNSTLCATERTICAILENYQTPEGIVVPSVLRKYLNDLQLIPYIK